MDDLTPPDARWVCIFFDLGHAKRPCTADPKERHGSGCRWYVPAALAAAGEPQPATDGELVELRKLSDVATQEGRYWEPTPHGHVVDGCRCGSCYGPSTRWSFGVIDDCESHGGPRGCTSEGMSYENAAFTEAAVNYVRAVLAAGAAPSTPHADDEPGSLRLGAEDRFHLWALLFGIQQECGPHRFGTPSQHITLDHIYEQVTQALAYFEPAPAPSSDPEPAGDDGRVERLRRGFRPAGGPTPDPTPGAES